MIRLFDSANAHSVFADCYADRKDEMSREDLMMKMSSWDIAIIELNGEEIGAVARKGGEFHFGILPGFRGKWATRSSLEKILEWVSESGPVRTAAAFNSLGERFATFVGMRVTNVTERGKYYAYP